MCSMKKKKTDFLRILGIPNTDYRFKLISRKGTEIHQIISRQMSIPSDGNNMCKWSIAWKSLTQSKTLN
jgi:hypothetical protein